MAMATEPRANYSYGKAKIYFMIIGEIGYLDVGEVPDCELVPEVETDEQFSSRSGTKRKILETIIQKKLTGSMSLMEYSEENLNIALMGDGVRESSQPGGSLNGHEVTTVENRFVELGKNKLSYLRIYHGDVTNGPLEVGDIATVDATTGTIVEVGTGYVSIINESGGTFAVGAAMTDGSDKSANITGRDTVTGIILADNGTPASVTKTYKQGTDYDCDVQGGMIRKRKGGAIADTVYVYADYSALTISSIKVLAGKQTEGKLKIVGNPDYGPKRIFESWEGNATLKVSGGLKYINETPEAIPISIEISEDSNHPDNPFGTEQILN